jgi:hypothetical protein
MSIGENEMKFKHVVNLIVGLNLAQAGARFAFAFFGLGSGMQQFINVTLSGPQQAILEFGFLTLGIIGSASVIGYVSKRNWALKAMAAVSIATVAFDIWGMTIAPTAALGFIVPVITLGYLLTVRMTSKRTEKYVPNEG